MNELLIFFGCAAAGALLGAIDGLLVFARKKLGIVFTVICDVLTAAAAFAALFLPALFLFDGVIHLPSGASLLAGFCIVRSCFRGKGRKTKRKAKKQTAENS